jgi:signal transduction histidine kinase
VVVRQDTGAGIAEEDLPHIFEPYFSTKQQKGTGLGLYISREIIARHGGRIWATSGPGRGSIFYVALPTLGASAPESG